MNLKKNKCTLQSVSVSYFDLYQIYFKGNITLFEGKEYIFDPNERQLDFSIGKPPTDGSGWRSNSR